jgi:hypothetical protein
MDAAMHVADRGQCVIGLCKVIERECTEMPRLPWILLSDTQYIAVEIFHWLRLELKCGRWATYADGRSQESPGTKPQFAYKE